MVILYSKKYSEENITSVMWYKRLSFVWSARLLQGGNFNLRCKTSHMKIWQQSIPERVTKQNCPKEWKLPYWKTRKKASVAGEEQHRELPLNNCGFSKVENQNALFLTGVSMYYVFLNRNISIAKCCTANRRKALGALDPLNSGSPQNTEANYLHFGQSNKVLKG